MKNKQKYPFRLTRKANVVVVVSILVIVSFWEIIFMGNIAYYAKWNECGQKPVIVRHPTGVGFGAAPERNIAYVNLDFFQEKKPLGWDVGNASVYCSLDEAHQAFPRNLEVVE